MTNAVKTILEAASQCEQHGRKVFIADAWSQYCVANRSAMTLETFKAQCLANRLELKLSRCDMPQCYDGLAVAWSEIAYMNATFHFIRLS